MADLVATSDPEADAKTMLERYWNYGGPTTPVPVDPIYVAAALGITVLVTRLESGVDGMLVKEPDNPTPTIYLSSDTGIRRQRFTCAHELGHWMKRSNGTDWAFVDKRNQLSGAGTDPTERYANQFAAALLMPEEAVNGFNGSISPDSLAQYFNVSAQAMGLRMTNPVERGGWTTRTEDCPVRRTRRVATEGDAVSEHDHREHVKGCYRCDLSQDEAARSAADQLLIKAVNAALAALDAPRRGYQIARGHIDERDVALIVTAALDAALPGWQDGADITSCSALLLDRPHSHLSTEHTRQDDHR